MAKLENRNIVITGSSHGLGRAIARSAAAAGANLLLSGRDEQALEETRAVAAEAGSKKVVTVAADVRSPSDVERVFHCAATEFGELHGLVNNAGVWGPKGRVENVSWEDWRAAIETNLYGVVLCTRAALPLLRAAGRAKIVNTSGGGATAPMPFVSAYAASKAAVVRFTETLAGELQDEGISVNALAPGALNTRMLDEILEAGPEKVGLTMYERALKQQAEGGASIERAAECCVYLLSEASDGITGKLISAVWDPWEILGEHQEELGRTDVYTLRRIIPEDRGLKFT